MLSPRLFFLYLLVFSVVLVPSRTHSSMSSANFAVPWDEWGSGGGEAGSSASYQIADTLGGTAVGVASSTSYTLLSGYRLGDARALSFSAAMAPVGGVSTPYSALDVSTKTITLELGVNDPNPFSVGDDVAIIENAGLSQLTAVGRVTFVEWPSVTVDRFEGDIGSMSATPSSAKVVALSGGNIAFGEISASVGAVATGMLSVQAPTPAGYTLFAQSVGDLISSSHTFSAVSDGAVSAGVEEYGIRTLGTTAVLLSDTPLTTTITSVQASSTASGPTDDRTAFLYKLAISSATPAGAYSQSVFFTLTANY